MTNEDAKTIMDNLIYLYRPLGNSLKAWHMAIEALEKADKYRWHDLRKNPDDLPEADEYGCSEYVLVMTGTPEWDNHEWLTITTTRGCGQHPSVSRMYSLGDTLNHLRGKNDT